MIGIRNIIKPYFICTKYLTINKTNNSFCKNINVNEQQKRFLNLLECDSKNLLRKYGVNVQDFMIVKNKTDINKIHNQIKAKEYVIKAQILAGGRGLGYFENGYQSGVHITNKFDDIENIIMNMIGQRLITKQTTKDGILVNKVMIANSVTIKQEKYICILLDTYHDGPIVIASPNGGTDIESFIVRNDEHLLKIFPIDIKVGVTEELAKKITTYLNFKESLHQKVIKQIISLWRLFENIDATQIEINPLVETDDGEIIAVDAKINFDDNAKFRQNHIMKIYEEIQYEELNCNEIQAAKQNLNYVELDGNIGCLVNGAGLAMATMDIIQLYGGKPANFLDVGGSVNKDQVSEGVNILISDKKVKSILINIFGGIVNCRIIADGIIKAMKNTKLDTSIVLIVRLDGNNVHQGKDLLENSNLPIKFVSDMDEGARLAVKSAI